MIVFHDESGEIVKTYTVEEWRQYRLEHAKHIFGEIAKLAQAKKWNEFVDMALAYPEYYDMSFQYFDLLPDELKHDFAVDAYTHRGDSVPIVRKSLRKCGKYGVAKLPDELRNMEFIEVYRAGEEPADKAKYRISWTTDINVARFFLGEYYKAHASHLYKGKIRPEHVIAYTDERKEREIMQYGHVFDIVEIQQ